MNLDLTEEQAALVSAFRGFFEKECPAARVRAAEPVGHDQALWDLTQEQGAVVMAVREAAGGWGASLLDLCLVVEQHGRALTPTPIVEAQTAARLLSALSGEEARDLLARLSAGRCLVAVSLRGEQEGTLQAVPGAAVADVVLFVRDGAVMAVELSDSNRSFTPNIGGLPLAAVDTAGARPVDEGPLACESYTQAIGDWMILTAAAVVGLASRALEIGCDYARERHQFGVPIATFQAVAHPLADSATAIEGARLLCYEAAWYAGAGETNAPAGPEMAFWYAGKVAADTVRRSLHVHGGYGFMTDYDIQLYFRRAKGWINVAGDPRDVLMKVADRRYGPTAPESGASGSLTPGG